MSSTGASKGARYFDRNRNGPYAEGASMSTVGTMQTVHGVYTGLTLSSCQYFLKIVTQQESEVKRPLNHRYMVFNVCRQIKQIRIDPLALSGRNSIETTTDIYHKKRVNYRASRSLGCSFTTRSMIASTSVHNGPMSLSCTSSSMVIQRPTSQFFIQLLTQSVQLPD